jgi:hypothetical protein
VAWRCGAHQRAPKLEFTSAFGGVADMGQRPALVVFDAIDPSRPLPPFVTFKSTLYKAKLAVGLQPE